jgi:hypothetical protein
MTDLNSSIAAVHADVQARVDRVKRARIELAASIEDLVVGRETVARESAVAVKFVDDYLNPTVANPEPLSPETVDVTLPPEEEIPVFTTVDADDLAFDNVSGGTVDIDEDTLVEEFGEFVEAPDAEAVAVIVEEAAGEEVPAPVFVEEIPAEVEVEAEDDFGDFVPGPSGGT